MFALVDCNNFYVSCERVFNPGLQGKAIVVLSNNDGCVIARSDEAKALDITMGMPFYLAKPIVKKHRVKVFSSNYALYGDMSDRVLKVMARFVPALEMYSIDEAFLDMQGMQESVIEKLAHEIQSAVFRETGIPVSIGIAQTKTLAKLASRIAKKSKSSGGIFMMNSPGLMREALEDTGVGKVWGIGSQQAAMLTARKVLNAYQFSCLPESWVREKMGVAGARTLAELKGISAFQIEEDIKPKKAISMMRAFGKASKEIKVIIEAISDHATHASAKLRNLKLAAKKMRVVIMTNPFRPALGQYNGELEIYFDVATNNATEILNAALRAVNILHQPGFRYMKCGLVISETIAEHIVQHALFDTVDHEKQKKIDEALDQINGSYGRNKLRFAIQGFDENHKRKSEFLSQRYTTRIDEIIHVKNDV